MLIHGDVLDVLQGTPDEVYHSCFCDPPYGLSFMGKRWDHGVPSCEVWREVWRVLRPGAVLMAFGGTRTWHRLAVNIEDAGFEMFDTVTYFHDPDLDQWAAQNYEGWCECDDSTP